MKYTIELTDNQKKQMDLLCEIAHKHIGFNPKLEPKEIQDSTYDVAYNKGLEDGYKGCKYLEEWFADTCFYNDEDNLFPEYERRQANTCCLEDIITDVGFSEVLKRVKAYEEKKEAEKEIKVGDIVYYGEEMLKAIVLDVVTEQGVTYAVMFDENGLNVNEKLSGLKFIEHTNEVSQLLDKLRGEDNE